MVSRHACDCTGSARRIATVTPMLPISTQATTNPAPIAQAIIAISPHDPVGSGTTARVSIDVAIQGREAVESTICLTESDR